MEDSHIEWTGNTFNIAEGCEKVSPGCKNCYAESRDKIWHHGCHWGPGSTRKMMSESYWQKPFKWNLQAGDKGIKIKVFCSSLCDVFEKHPDLIIPRARLFAMIADTPNLVWQLLTKRPENIMRMVPTHWITQEWPGNVWMGTTVESQDYADIRIPYLLRVPSAIRFLSCEPLLGPIDLSMYFVPPGVHHHPKNTLTGDTGMALNRLIQTVNPDLRSEIGWVICGGESGNGARPMHPDWARSLRDQCNAAGVAFFFKQWGEYKPYQTNPVSEPIPLSAFSCKKMYFRNNKFIEIPGHLPVNEAMKDFVSFKVGKKTAGALLDGIEHKEFPDV